MAASPLPRKTEQIIAALLTCRRLEDAARQAKVSLRALRNYQSDPAFQTAFRAARRQIVEGAIARAQGLMHESIDTLRRLLTCGQPATERAAAETLLAYGTRGIDADMAERLDAVEQTLKERRKHDNPA